MRAGTALKKWSIFNSESVDVGRVELQGISNEFRLLILRERIADKGIQVAIGLKRPRLSSQATQTPSTIKQKKTGLNVDMDEAVMRAKGSTGSGDMMI